MNSSSGADDLFGAGWGGTPSARTAGSGSMPSASVGGIDPGDRGFAGAPSATFAVVHPPLHWLYAAIGTAVLALVLAIVFWGIIPLAILGWVLGGAVTIGLTALFQVADTNRRTQLGYSSARVPLATVLYIGALAIGLGAVVVSAVDLALWAGRGF